MRVLPQIRFDDPQNRMPQRPVLCQQHEHAVLDLLEDIGPPVWTVDFDGAPRLVDHRLVTQRPEPLPGVRQRPHQCVLGLRA